MGKFKEINRKPGTKLLKWERAKRYFLADGWKEVEGTSKMLKFTKPGQVFIFVGKAGAIRKGKTRTDSLDMAPSYWKRIECWEDSTGKGDKA